jgi:GNAT superfamily N-acetyltransferase
MTQPADSTLAERLEALAADEMRRFVATSRMLDPEGDVASLEIDSGVAIYLGTDSPVNQAVGLGFSGRFTAEQAEALESFYASRGQRGLAVVCPLAHHSLVTRLAERGWVLDAFENVLIRDYDGDLDEPPDGIEIVEVDDDEGRAVWTAVAAAAFVAPLDPPPAQQALARVVAARPGPRLLLALVDGQPAGTGELYVDDGVAWLSADATLPSFRRRGVQRALQLRRLAMGAEAGCELAVTEAIPGSPSQRNMERLGFRVAYTRADLLAPARVG